MKFVADILLKLWGWKIIGTSPNLKKYLFIVVPHSSNWDFLLGLLVRSSVGFKANYIGKEALFRAPWGWIFRALGGHPVKRDKNYKQVDQIIDIYKREESFAMAIAPEGTRSKVNKWKTGFYYIAKGAEVPIVMVAFDYGKKEVRFSEPFYTTDDVDKDFEYMYKYFEGVKRRKEN